MAYSRDPGHPDEQQPRARPRHACPVCWRSKPEGIQPPCSAATLAWSMRRTTPVGRAAEPDWAGLVAALASVPREVPRPRWYMMAHTLCRPSSGSRAHETGMLSRAADGWYAGLAGAA